MIKITYTDYITDNVWGSVKVELYLELSEIKNMKKIIFKKCDKYYITIEGKEIEIDEEQFNNILIEKKIEIREKQINNILND